VFGHGVCVRLDVQRDTPRPRLPGGVPKGEPEGTQPHTSAFRSDLIGEVDGAGALVIVFRFGFCETVRELAFGAYELDDGVAGIEDVEDVRDGDPDVTGTSRDN